MIDARETFTKFSKPRKGQEIPKFTKAFIIYRQNFQDYQIQTLNILKNCIVNG
jgi:hypothetical protein